MHQNRASPFASDFDRRRGYRKEFRSEDHFYPFSSQKKKTDSLAIFFAEEIAHLGASKSRAIFPGAVKIAAATAENRAILVHSDGSSSPTLMRHQMLNFDLGPAKTYSLGGTSRTYAIKTRAVTNNWTIQKDPNKGNGGPVRAT